MDLYFQAAAVMLAGAALAFLIFVMMTPAQMFAPFISDTNRLLQARIDAAVNMDIMLFNNATSIPGTSILPLLQDASANQLAVFVQTRAGQGLVVNYGHQMRSAQSTGVRIRAFGTTGITNVPTDFERNFVIPAQDLFGIQNDQPIPTGTSRDAGSIGIVMGTAGPPGSNFTMTAVKPSASADNAMQFYQRLTTPEAAATGFNGGSTPWMDPLLHFWDPFSITSEVASQRGRSYSSTGYLFTAQMLRTNMPQNNNLSFSQTQGTPFYVNAGSFFHTTFILDASGLVIGLYVEEHGVHQGAAFLAAAMVSEGYINEAIQFN